MSLGQVLNTENGVEVKPVKQLKTNYSQKKGKFECGKYKIIQFKLARN